MRQNKLPPIPLAQSHFRQPNSPDNKRLLSRAPSTSTIDARADSIAPLAHNTSKVNNIARPTRMIRRAASVDNDSVHPGREKYQQPHLVPNRLFGPPSPKISDSSCGANTEARSGAIYHKVSPDGDEKRTESSRMSRNVVPQDRSFRIGLDNEEDATSNNNISNRSLIFRRSPTTKPSLGRPPLQHLREATPVNFGTSSVPLGNIRPSLSCPSPVFDSPLLPAGSASINHRREQLIMTCQSNDTDTDRLNAVDVSAIEYCEDSPSGGDSSEEIHGATDGNPTRNLSGAFELLVSSENDLSKKQKQKSVRGTINDPCDITFEDNNLKSATATTSSTSTKPSPTSVLGFDTNNPASPPATKQGEAVQLENGITVLRMSLPRFQLHEDLRGEMHQGLIDRVSFYNIVRDINKEAADAAMSDPKGNLYNDEALNVVAEDGKVHAHPIRAKENNNILVLSCTSNSQVDSSKPVMSTALLDEEWWLLSAMSSRTPEEVTMNHASALPSTFSEALGEKDNSTADPMTSSSKTQLWKPGRSWWEAKSGKNPWVEPVVHNSRWRYLWPLIHYHKFLAKSIRKLRRNGIDVKTSTSTLSMFLRQEVCNVSDHLAFVSKYDSEEWTNALRCFDGWADHNADVEESVRKLVLQQKLQDINDISDLESSLLRSQISDAMLKAINSEKEKVSQDTYSQREVPASKRPPNDDAKNGNVNRISVQKWKRPPVHKKTPNKSTAASRGARWNSAGYNAPIVHHGMYGQQFQPQHPYVHPPYGQFPSHHHHQYNAYEHYPPHYNFGYTGAQFPVDHYGQHHYYQNYPVDGGLAETSFDGSTHNSEASASVMFGPDDTPTRYARDAQYPPASPYWNHLNLSQLPGLCSPSCQLSPASSFNAHTETDNPIVGKPKSLIMFPKKTNSPASRFNMSPQDYSLPYYATRNTAPVNGSSLNDSVPDESFVLPTIEGFSAETPEKKSVSDA